MDDLFLRGHLFYGCNFIPCGFIFLEKRGTLWEKGSEELKKIWITLCLALAVLFIGGIAAQAANIYVEDGAKVLSEATKERINTINQEFKELANTPQYAVITTPRLKDESIEEYAVRRFEELGIGQKGQDNGLLFILVPQDREYRLEVGYGLEDIVPDGMKDYIISDDVVAELKAEDYDQAVLLISNRIADVVAQKVPAEVVDQYTNPWRGPLPWILSGLAGVGVLGAGGAGWWALCKRKIKKMLQETYDMPDESVWHVANGHAYQVSFLELAYHFYQALPENLTTEEIQTELEGFRFKTYTASAVLAAAKSQPERAEFVTEKYFDPFWRSLDRFPTDVQIDQYIKATALQIETDKAMAAANMTAVLERTTTFVAAKNKSGKEQQLLASLMRYDLVKEADLSEPNLLANTSLFNDTRLDKAYKFALSKAAEIEDEYMDEAIRDLATLQMISYVSSSLDWSDYQSSSSSGSGGDSFGGGSSGGGGFSGSW